MTAVREIETSEDVKLLVDSFYSKVLKDKELSYIFNEVAQLDLNAHMPVMYSFWESMLFGTASYKGNPMTSHIILNKKVKLTDSHFERWRTLFFETLDELFDGTKAEEAKQRVDNMIALMKYKLASSEQKGFIQ